MAKVVVTVMGTEVGTWHVAPYSRQLHLDASVVYDVPIYEVVVGTGLGSPIFKAIRFGLVNKGQRPPPATRLCDAGLADPQTVFPSWVPSYSPHSFQGGIRRGAWKLYPGKDFLIHEGAADNATMIGGSLGCIEIVGPMKWNQFLDAIEAQAGAPCATVAQKTDLKVILQKAARPTAKLVSGP